MTADLESRLRQSFQAVFPDVGDATTASPTTVGAWDSVATITLLAVLEEEFGVMLTLEDLGDVPSYQTTLAALQTRLPQS